MEDRSTTADVPIEIGEAVYDEEGHHLGYVNAFTDDGFETETVPREEGSTEDIPGHGVGQGYLMWRCTECGEMDEIEDGLPERCPNCGAGVESITEAIED